MFLDKKPLGFKYLIYTYFLKGVVAHAFFPEFGGDAHFDNGENWTVDKYSVGVFGKLKNHLKIQLIILGCKFTAIYCP